MGNIRSFHIKTIAKKLVKAYPNEFNTDFQHNKKQVEVYTDIKRKKLRNSIAGYVTTYRARYEA